MGRPDAPLVRIRDMRSVRVSSLERTVGEAVIRRRCLRLGRACLEQVWGGWLRRVVGGRVVASLVRLECAWSVEEP